MPNIKSATNLVDKNGNPINNGNMISYNGENYIVMSADKDDTLWIAHPCGNNQNTEDLNLAQICVNAELS